MINLIISLLYLYLPFQIALNPTEGIDLASVRIIIPFIFLLWLVNGLKSKKILIPYNKITLLIASFLFLSGFSLLFAENIQWGIRKLLFFLSIFPLYLVLPREENQKITVLKFLILGTTLSAIAGIIQFSLQFSIGLNRAVYFWGETITPFLGNSFSEAVLENSSWLVSAGGGTLFRAISFFPDPHMFSFYLGMSAPIALSLYLATKKSQMVYLVLFIVIIFTNLLTFSRGGYMGLIFGLSFMLIFLYKDRFRASQNIIKNILVIPFLFTFIFIFLIIFPNPIADRLYSSFNIFEGSNSERMEIWKESIEVIKEHPLLGTGLGNYSLSVKPSAEYREPIYSHNLYMDIAAETGILNSILWILIILFSISKSLDYFKKEKNVIYLGLASSLVVFSIHSIFDTALFSVHILPFFVLIISLINNKSDISEKN